MTLSNKNRLRYLTEFIVLALLITGAIGSEILAEEPYTRLVQKIETSELGISDPAGIAFWRSAGAFLIAPGLNTTEMVYMPGNQRMFNTVTLQTAIPNPANMAFDDKRSSLVFFNEANEELVQLQFKADAQVEISSEGVIRHNTKLFDPEDLQGITFDSETGDVFFLVVPGQSEWARIIRMAVNASNKSGELVLIQTILLTSLPRSKLRGIAFNPDDGHLFVLSLADQVLYELSGQGEVVSNRDVSAFGLSNAQNMLFAPSGDQTDDPSILSLYILDGGNSLRHAGIVELTLIPPKPRNFSPRALDFTFVQNIHTWAWDPPSPDASGICYIPSTGHLLVCDGEINEGTWNPPLWGGYNVWEINLTNSPFGGFNTLDFNDEPTDVAYNPNNQHLYFSRDNSPKSIFEVDAGPDGVYGTGDDIVISTKTSDYGSSDPEGVTYDTEQGHVFWVDGVNREVYDLNLGPDGAVGGGDDVVTHFDTQSLGASDPEGIEFNPDNGHLYILGSNDIIVETTRNGTYIQEASINSLNPSKPAGLAYAPTSNNPFAKSLYIVCRGTDNDGHPTENDGEIYEITLGSFIPTLSIDDVGLLEGDNGTTNAVFTVTLSSPTQDVVTVDYATADGSALVSNNDYVPTSGQVEFQPGETSQPITVEVNGDGVDEEDETFYVNLSNAVNAPISDDQGVGTILNDDGPQLITIDFQDGTNGYSGTRDTYIDAGGSNHGSEAVLLVDGSPQYSTLLYWDVSVIPPGSMIQSVDIQVNVVDPTGDLYEVYELYRPWVEGEATWNQYATSQNWEIPGVLGSGDRGSTVLGDISSGLGLHTISLNAAGVAAVQAWIDDPSSNHGVIIQDYANTGGLDLSSRESGTVSQRPMLTVSFYLPPSLTLTAPNGGESWQVGSSQDITWSSEGAVSDVKLEYSTNGGTSWGVITSSTTNDGTEPWTIPAGVTSAALVRISDVPHGNPVDVSDDVFTIAPEQVLVEVKIFLEGPYNSSTGEMTTSLNANGYIPETSPYSEDPRTVAPIPADITDWVLVELRETDTGPAVASKSALLKKNGLIVADDGITQQILVDVSPGAYYIVVKHRNHLAVMSAGSVQLNSGSSTLYDFTIDISQYFGVGGAKEIETDVWGMWSGDTDQSRTVDANDRASTWNDRNQTGYFDSDCKLSGTVDANSRAMTWNNRNKISTLP